MTTARPSITAPSAWDRICSGVGYHLDNLGRWLIVNAPAIGSTYAPLVVVLLGEHPARPRPQAGDAGSTTTSGAGWPAGAAPCGKPPARRTSPCQSPCAGTAAPRSTSPWATT